MNEIVFIACSAFIVIEMISFLSGNEKTVKTICSLSLTMIILTSAVSALGKINISSLAGTVILIDEEPLYISETQGILEDQMNNALSAAGVTDVISEVILSMDENYEVSVDSVKVGVKHRADLERAKIIIREVFSNAIESEVYLIDE